MTDEQIRELEQRLQGDEGFRQAFDREPVQALEAVGMNEHAAALRVELERLTEAVERVDPERFQADPSAELIAAGIPAPSVPAVLRAAGASSQVIEESTQDVEAHGLTQDAKVRLLILLTTSSFFLVVIEQALAGIRPGS